MTATPGPGSRPGPAVTTDAPPAARTGASAAPPPGGRAVTGDGTTARSRAGRRWRAARWTVLVVVVVGVVAGGLALVRAPSSGTPFAPDNPAPDGAQAVARILGDHGVHVDDVRSVDAAVRAAGPGTTLAILPGTGRLLEPGELARLAAVPADVVLLGPDTDLLAAVAPALRPGYGWSGTPVLAEARCDDPDAVAAGSVTTVASGFVPVDPADTGVTVCFPVDDALAPSGTGSYAVVRTGHRVAAFDDPALVTNRALARAGNAALALRMLGRHDHLVWLVPQETSVHGPGGSLLDLLPGWFRPTALWVLVVAALAVWWRAPRLGPLVPEDLPVVVRSSETTRGRGRLYRAGGSRGHAAAGLRAASADRLARSLGLPRSAGADELVDAVVRATARDAATVTQILYGPPPPDDAALLRLATTLDDLESEVRP